MITLDDGRSELYQWDTGRKIKTEIECDQIHFSNTVYTRTYDMPVVDGSADIPDELLQYGEDLHAWCFEGTYENGYTKHEQIFTVKKRAKPSGYVFTPTEKKTLESIQKQIGNLDELSTAAKNNLVEAINEIFFSGGAGNDCVGIKSIEQTTTSTVDSGINVVTVTLTDGTKNTFEIRNGSKGSTGAQGIQGETGATGPQGVQGPSGADGYSPVRGIDYWNDNDKNEIVDAVLEALPAAEDYAFGT